MAVNCHCHVFSLACVPAGFRQRFLLDRQTPWQDRMHDVVRRLLPEHSMLGEWLGMVDRSIGEIADLLVAEMDEAGVDLATPLMMDMAYCEGFGGGVLDFEQQIAETEAAVQRINAAAGRTRLLPFVAAEPRRPDVARIVCDTLERGVCRGVKIYPVMGFTPDDRRLWPVYEYCAEHGMPVTAHCQDGGIPGLGDYYHLAAPRHWEPVLADFPALVLNLAHNDRTGSEWQQTIERLIGEHQSVYTDVAYDLEMWYAPVRYFRHVQHLLATPGLQDRLLYGTDWYMGRCFWTEASYLAWFRDYAARIPFVGVRFGDEELRRLTEANPRRFLGLSSLDDTAPQAADAAD
ncbi:MAG: amidohydrolase family protein [bacterium]